MSLKPQIIKLEPQPREVPILALNCEEAAEALSLGMTLFRSMVSEGKIHPVMAGSKPIFPIEELQRYLRENLKK